MPLLPSPKIQLATLHAPAGVICCVSMGHYNIIFIKYYLTTCVVVFEHLHGNSLGLSGLLLPGIAS